MKSCFTLPSPSNRFKLFKFPFSSYDKPETLYFPEELFQNKPLFSLKEAEVRRPKGS